MKNYSYKKTSDGQTEYYNEDHELHRLDGPAIVNANGKEVWWRNGQMHRDNAPAKTFESIIDGGMVYEWWHNGMIHREDGPAIYEDSGYKEWVQENKRHRLDGPAVVDPRGRNQWWVDGKELTQKDFENHPKVLEAKRKNDIKKKIESL